MHANTTVIYCFVTKYLKKKNFQIIRGCIIDFFLRKLKFGFNTHLLLKSHKIFGMHRRPLELFKTYSAYQQATKKRLVYPWFTLRVKKILNVNQNTLYQNEKAWLLFFNNPYTDGLLLKWSDPSWTSIPAKYEDFLLFDQNEAQKLGQK